MIVPARVAGDQAAGGRRAEFFGVAGYAMRRLCRTGGGNDEGSRLHRALNERGGGAESPGVRMPRLRSFVAGALLATSLAAPSAATASISRLAPAAGTQYINTVPVVWSTLRRGEAQAGHDPCEVALA